MHNMGSIIVINSKVRVASNGDPDFRELWSVLREHESPRAGEMGSTAQSIQSNETKDG